MKTRTQQIRLAELIRDVKKHPHKEELIEIMYQQVQDESDNRFQMYKSIPNIELLVAK